MIAGFRDRADRTVSAAVMLRDAIRLARRWQTYAIRVAFSAALIGLVLVAIVGVTEATELARDKSSLGQAGKFMFSALSVAQVLVAALIAPFTVASAVIEEREQGTIELLLVSRLDARRILSAKILARLLLLLTVVLGGLPVLALVMTIGGVSVIEVVAVTVHALVACVVLGVLAGFFAVFTQHAAVAVVASLVYGFLAFLFAPVLYTTLTGDWRGLASFSPLYGTTARDAWALLPALTYAPIVGLALTLGARFYELKVSRARLMQFFLNENWRLPSLWWVSIAVGVGMLTILPFAMAGSWFYTIALAGGGPTGPWSVGLDVLGGASRFVVWGWCVGVLYLGTWLYMRLTADMVVMTDDIVDPRMQAWSSRPVDVHVWSNPVAWRSLRRAHWRAVAPALGGWLVVLLVVFQAGIWVIPGGLLVVGGLNTVAMLIMAVWLGASSIEVERRTGSLEILLTSTLDAFSIVAGKLMGVLAPSAPLMALTVPLLVLGGPHLYFLFLDSGAGFATATLRGAVAAAWVGSLWLLSAVGSMTLALAMPKPRNAYPVAIVSLGLYLLVPPALAGFTEGVPVAHQVLRLLVPVLVREPAAWEMAVSGGGMLLLAAVLFAVCCARLRTWGLRHA